MKRLFIGVIIFCVLLSMSACVSSQMLHEETMSSSTTETTTETISEKEIRLGEMVTVGEYAFQLTNIKTEESIKNGGSYYSPGEDKVWVVVEYLIYNNARKECSGSLSLTLDYDNSYERISAFKYTENIGDNYEIIHEVSPGKQFKGSRCAEMYKSMYDDNSCALKLEISFYNENFVYYINR